MANEVFKALGHPLRRQVMALLRQGPKSSGELAEAFDAAWPTVTRHLTVLKDADLITAERRGTSIILMPSFLICVVYSYLVWRRASDKQIESNLIV